MENDPEMSIRGIVIPAAWDEAGNVKTLAIATYGEERYLVDESPEAEPLRALLRKRVLANGAVRKAGKDRRITITSFSTEEEGDAGAPTG